MADMSTPLKNTAFTLSFTLYKNDGTIVANPGTYTKKVSVDGAAVADIAAAVTEEDTTYGQLSLVLSAAEMNGDFIWVYITDNTAGTVPFTCSLYPAAGAPASAAALAIVDDFVDDIESRLTAARAGYLDALNTGVPVASIAAGAITAAAIATNAIDDDALAADAVTAIQSGLATAASVTTIDDMLDTELPAITAAVITNAAGVDIAADIIALKAVADTIQADTDLLDDAAGGLADIHTDVAAVKADTAAVLAAIPAASAVADAVWDEVLAGHAGAGSTGQSLSAIKAKTETIGALSVTVTSPVAASGTVSLYQGDDYASAHGRELAFTVADAGHELALDAVGAVVRLKATQATWTAASVTSTAAGYTVVFEPTAAQTAALTIKRQAYELEATLADSDVVTLATGTLELTKDIPVVV